MSRQSAKRVFNFGAGPATLPLPVMEKARDEFLDYQGLGAGVIEISHRSAQFGHILDSVDSLLRQLAAIPDNYRILYVHGGAQMQFAAVPLNLLGRASASSDAKSDANSGAKQPAKPATAAYIETGNFARLARKEAQRYGKVIIAASSEGDNFNHIPECSADSLPASTAYLHLTANNTVYGTRWQQFPATGDIPLVADMTSEFLSRRLDIKQFGIIYAGLQKNLGPSGLACVIIRDDLIGHALPQTPALLDYQTYAESRSLANTPNTFALYMMKGVLEWLRDEGGVAAIEQRNAAKAGLLYKVIDESDFYRGTAHKVHRSIMNVCFVLADDSLLAEFLKQADAAGLYALKGHRSVGGVRASIYNAMPVAGCEALADFMQDFEKRKG